MNGHRAFKKHQGCDCHREAMEALVLPRFVKDVGELLSAEHEDEKALDRTMLLLPLQNLRFLSRQALSGDRD